MKILFSMRHPGALRNFSSTIRALAARGHAIHLLFSIQNRYGDDRLLHELLDEYPALTYATLPKKRPYRLCLGLARTVRTWLDYLRYLEPEYAAATMLRARAEERTPPAAVRLSRAGWLSGAAGRRLLRGTLRLFERVIPTDGWVDEQIRAARPDVVLVTPLVDLGSDQTEYVKSARALGIPVGLPVHSWDNLTNKGLIRVAPDRVFVWNESQKQEAVAMHGIDAGSVVVTGAPVFDQWFERKPSTTRDAFCARTGLPADRRFILYLGSSAFIAADEAAFVTTWLRALRTAPDASVREAAVLIRPHPQNVPDWERFDLSEFPNVAIWPRAGADPVDAQTKNDFFDSLYHASAAVGINTTALIEAGILNRPVLTVRFGDAGTQEGTLHFHYLLKEGGGLVTHGETLDEHVRQLAAALGAPERGREGARAFLESFVRPHGLDQPATPRLVEGIEALGALERRAASSPLPLYPLRLVVYPAALLHNLARRLTARPSSRGLGALTLKGAIVRQLTALLDVALAWRPVRGFVKKVVVPRVISRSEPQSAADEIAAVRKTLDRLSASRAPIIVGPWLSELGFEVLYWVPFLQWATANWPLDPERLTIVSRGGVQPWYAHVGGRYLELFDLFTPTEFRELNERRVREGRQKQHEISEVDQDIVKRVRAVMGRPDAEVLHPMLMYRLFNPYWSRQALSTLVERHTVFERLPGPPAPALEGALPDDFIAVRFYFNDCFPETESNRRFVARLLVRLTQTSDVVMLNSGLNLDDHVDFSPVDRRRIHTIDRFMTPQNNLHIQTAVISRARGFVGTYGGLAYLPPLYGVNSLAFFSRTPSVAVQHLEFAQQAASRISRGSFTALDVASADLVSAAFGAGDRVAVPL